MRDSLHLVIDILFAIIIGYFVNTFIQVLLKMKKEIIFPLTTEQVALRKHPERPLALPTYSHQKSGIVMYSIILLFVITMFGIALFTDLFNWSVYLLLFLPLANSYQLLNLFAVVEDGILSGSRFIAWKHMKSFHFVRIDGNHKYYGYSKEVNDKYELKVKAKGFPISCVVISDTVKERLTEVLAEHVQMIDNKDMK